jgi:hypothetical protein
VGQSPAAAGNCALPRTEHSATHVCTHEQLLRLQQGQRAFLSGSAAVRCGKSMQCANQNASGRHTSRAREALSPHPQFPATACIIQMINSPPADATFRASSDTGDGATPELRQRSGRRSRGGRRSSEFESRADRAPGDFALPRTESIPRCVKHSSEIR